MARRMEERIQHQMQLKAEEENNFLLLTHYKDQPILWNPKHPNYRAVKPTVNAWHKCAFQMDNMPMKDFKRSIVGLLKKYVNYRQQNFSLVETSEWCTFAESFLGPVLFPDAEKIEQEKKTIQSVRNVETLPKLSDDKEHKHQVRFRLMQFYKLMEILWNPNYPQFGKPGPTKRAWKELVKIINIQGMTRMTARHEVMVLRRRFIEKRKTLSFEEIANYKEKHDWFSMADSFLGPLLFGSIITRRVTDTKLNQVYLIEDQPTESNLIAKVELDDNMVAEVHLADNLVAKVKITEAEDTLHNKDTTNMCRACLQVFCEADLCLHSLDYTYVGEIQLRVIYKKLVGCDNPESESFLPAFICVDCEKLLLSFHDFRTKCRCNESDFLKRVNLFKETTVISDLATIQQNEEANFDVEAMVDASYTLPDDFYLDLTEDTVADEVEIVTEVEPQLIEEHNFDKSKKYKCGDCEKSFMKSSYLIRHFRKVHNVPDAVLQKLTSEFQQVQEKEPLNSVCPICGEERRTKLMNIHLKRHESNNERYQCYLCQRDYKSKEGIRCHMDHKHLKKSIYRCQHCMMQFTSYAGRYRHTHLKHYTLKAEFTCEVCDRQFPSEMTLRYHRRNHVNSGKSFTCQACDKSFTCEATLRTHKNRVHLMGQTYPCALCSKVFTSKKFLRSHSLVHTGEKNYECPVCGNFFSQNPLLRAHVEKKHPAYKLPPKGTILNLRALKKKEKQEQLEKTFVKLDFIE